MGKGTGLAAILNIDAFAEGDYLVMLTQNGLIKRTPLKAFAAVRAGGLTAIKLKVRHRRCRGSCPAQLELLHSMVCMAAFGRMSSV